MPDRTAAVRFAPVSVPGTAGAWTVAVDDPRFGGVSALALRDDRLLALTDSGVLVDLPRPGKGAAARLHDLPDGPGPANQRRWRDSEALLRDRSGSWWVAFENRHSIWRYDSDFKRGERVIDLMARRWSVNEGVEGLISEERSPPLLVPESGRELLRIRRRKLASIPLSGVPGKVADATRLPDGRILVLVRQVGTTGIGNSLGELRLTQEGARVEPMGHIAVGPLTNLEAVAAESLPSGATRLWLMSDNDFSDWRRTILLAIELPSAATTRAPSGRS